jgi:hypothetical protein
MQLEIQFAFPGPSKSQLGAKDIMIIVFIYSKNLEYDKRNKDSVS